MKHSISLNSAEFAEAIKTAVLYASRDGDPANGLCHILLVHMPKLKKIAIIACDGHGYYERRLSLVASKGIKASLPDKEQRLCIPVENIALLSKFVGSKSVGNITLEVEDDSLKDNRYCVTLVLPNGGSTTFFARTGINIPDYSKFCKKAENSKKAKPVLSNLLIPVYELARAAKAFPAKIGTIARIFTCNAEMILLELEDIRVIFTFARETAAEA